MMTAIRVVLTTAVFWSLVLGRLSPSWSTKTSAPLDRVSRDVSLARYILPDNVVPNSYKIKLIPEMDGENFTFKGQSEIDISVKKPTREITLHSKNLDIDDSIRLECNLIGEPAEIINVLGKSIDNETDFLKIILEEELLVGYDCILTLSYMSTYESSQSRQGISEYEYSEENTTKRMVTTHLEPIYARRAFPCWDEPSLKANFSISIEHNNKYVALSNMPVERYDVATKDATRRVTQFQQSPKMSTYLVAFAIGDFAPAVYNDTGNFRVWARKEFIHNGKYIQDLAIGELSILDNYLDFAYEKHGLKKMDILVIPRPGFPAGMESWGLIICDERILNWKGNFHSHSQKEMSVTLLAHELAHQWFGNLVTASRWDYIWQTEGFAKYFEHIIVDQIKPTWRMKDRFVTEILQRQAFVGDGTRDGNHAIYVQLTDPNFISLIFNGITYAKSACIIRMISHVVGNDKFHARLKHYIKTHAFGSVNSSDFLWLLADGNRGLYDFMWNWISVPGYPVVTVTRDYAAETAIITQSRYLEDDDKTSTEKYYVPLNFVTEDQLDFSETTIVHWFSPWENVIQINQLNREKFVIFNKQQMGYYRVNYDERNWKMITKYLKTKNHSEIHVINRAQLIDDAFSLAKVNQLKYNVALSVIGYLGKETDYLVWTAMWKSFRYIYDYVANTEYAENLKNYILHLSGHVLKEVICVLSNGNNHIMEMNKPALYWHCKLGSQLCISVASEELDEWLKNSDRDPQTRLPEKWIICGGGQMNNEKMLDKLWKIYLSNADEIAFFDGIECTSNITIVEKYFSQAIADKESGSVHFARLLRRFYFEANGEGVNVALEFMVSHYNEMIGLEGYGMEQFKTDLTLIGKKLTNENQLLKLTKFIEQNEDSLKHSADEILKTVRKNIESLKERLKEFKQFFEKDIYYESFRTALKMQNNRMQFILSIDFTDNQRYQSLEGMNFQLN